MTRGNAAGDFILSRRLIEKKPLARYLTRKEFRPEFVVILRGLFIATLRMLLSQNRHVGKLMGNRSMVVESTQLEVRRSRHLEELKSQIARCLDQEMDLKAEERRDRARQLGIDLKISQHDLRAARRPPAS
jgi:hypothetical protein